MGLFLFIFFAVCVVVAIATILSYRKKEQREIEREFEEFLKRNMDVSKFHILMKGDEVTFIKADADPKQDGKRVKHVIIDESEGTTDEVL